MLRADWSASVCVARKGSSITNTLPTIPDTLLDDGHVGNRIRVDTTERSARPEAVLVHMYGVGRYTALDHGSDAAISNDKGVTPALGRCRCPDTVAVRRRVRLWN